jgi:hypothetical protein
MSGAAEFSVYWWDPDGRYYAERRFIVAEEAVKLAESLARRPAARIGIIRMIRITDGGDFTVFEWQFGKGVVFPEAVKT